MSTIYFDEEGRVIKRERKIEEIIKDIHDLTDELSEQTKGGTFDLTNGTLKVEFTSKASEL